MKFNIAFCCKSISVGLLFFLSTQIIDCDAFIVPSNIQGRGTDANVHLFAPSSSKHHSLKHQHTESSIFKFQRLPQRRSVQLDRTSLQMSGSPSLISSMTTLFQAFSQSTDSITSILSSTPSLVYFLCLAIAGFGIPISEDALCIFVGTILPTIWAGNPGRRNRLILALYGGVVLSDFITFNIGRFLKAGIMEPIRKRMNLQSERINFCDSDDDDMDIISETVIMDGEEDEFCQIDTSDLRKMDEILGKLEKAGNFAGFFVRFSVGIRTPMMLLTGYSGKVSFPKYALGTITGAFCSLSLQLLIGWSMRNNPSSVVAVVGSISIFAFCVPVTLAFISWVSLMRNRYLLFRT
mmetsp:Transcript_13364/g.19478  ORF Transcript_13364/g.19478 Transcript_13364/m.19478 type:complete len:351 (-) Transcript_13364:296-1348(-)